MPTWRKNMELRMERRLLKGDVLFAEGDPGDRLYVVTEGKLKLGHASNDGRETLLAAGVHRACALVVTFDGAGVVANSPAACMAGGRYSRGEGKTAFIVCKLMTIIDPPSGARK